MAETVRASKEGRSTCTSSCSSSIPNGSRTGGAGVGASAAFAEGSKVPAISGLTGAQVSRRHAGRRAASERRHRGRSRASCPTTTTRGPRSCGCPSRSAVQTPWPRWRWPPTRPGTRFQDAAREAGFRLRGAIVPGRRVRVQGLVPAGASSGSSSPARPGLILLGAVLFAVVVLFQLVTLPVEFGASHKALAMLTAQGVISQPQVPVARKVLTAAAHDLRGGGAGRDLPAAPDLHAQPALDAWFQIGARGCENAAVRLISYHLGDGRPRCGRWEDDAVLELEGAASAQVLAGDPAQAGVVAERAFADVTLLPAVPDPGKIALHRAQLPRACRGAERRGARQAAGVLQVRDSAGRPHRADRAVAADRGARLGGRAGGRDRAPLQGRPPRATRCRWSAATRS